MRHWHDHYRFGFSFPLFFMSFQIVCSLTGKDQWLFLFGHFIARGRLLDWRDHHVPQPPTVSACPLQSQTASDGFKTRGYRGEWASQRIQPFDLLFRFTISAFDCCFGADLWNRRLSCFPFTGRHSFDGETTHSCRGNNQEDLPNQHQPSTVRKAEKRKAIQPEEEKAALNTDTHSFGWTRLHF